MKSAFLRVIEADDKAASLLEAVRTRGRQWFDVDTRTFANVPGSPFAYWMSEQVLRLFKSLKPIDGDGRLIVSTNPLNDDFRYVRSWWEVSSCELRQVWMPWAKGGSYSPIYYDIDTTIRWDSARLTYAGYLGTENRPLERPASVQHFFRPGLTWPRRTNGLSFRVMPAGCIFADKGPAAFVKNDDTAELLVLACITNSKAFGTLVSLQLARTELAQSYEVGLIQNTPIPPITAPERGALTRLARRTWSLKRALDIPIETSHAFTLPAALNVAGTSIADRAATWLKHVQIIETELAEIRAMIDERCFALYSISDADRHAITEGFSNKPITTARIERTQEIAADADQELNEFLPKVDSETVAAELVSWCVGVAVGRFDVRLAVGARPLPSEPEPFDSLPVCSPGMLVGDEGLPVTRPPTGYPIAFRESGVLVDDPGHADDLTAAVRTTFNAVFETDPDRWLYEVAALLETTGHDLRTWLSKNFFDFHLKRYSKSRRRAPIIWQLSTSSGRYSVFLYAHRLTRDTFFQLQTDVVGPKLALEERRLTSLIQTAGINATASQRREIDEQKAVVEELTGMLDDIKRIAPLWSPNLDDGIVLTMAPLWRLVPQHRSWQKELKSKWDELMAGKYDWAHLAMHLWPERVVPKCATDRSAAIAHGLEEVFWVEGPDGKWTPRTTPLRTIEDLIRERSSPAVKAALSSLIEAPSAQSTGATRARGRASGTTARGDRH